MSASDMLLFTFLLSHFIVLTSVAIVTDEIDVTKEAFAITQKDCSLVKDVNKAPPIMRLILLSSEKVEPSTTFTVKGTPNMRSL